MYKVSISNPNNDELKVGQFSNVSSIVDFVNSSLFSNIKVATMNTIYSLITRPHITKAPFKPYISIQKLSSVPK